MAINKTQHTTMPDAAPLVLSASIDADVKSAFVTDRYLGDTLQLPYTFDEIKIKTNDLCTSDTYNGSIYKLYYNFLYLNAQTKIASNKFPQSYKGYIASNTASTSANVGWYSSSNASSQASVELNNTNGTILSGIVDGAFVKELGTSNDFVGVVANSLTLIALSGNYANSTTGIRLNTKFVEDATSLSFTDIKSLAINSENNLFVCNGTNIHKFDIDAVLTTNPAIGSIGRFLIKTIGGNSTDIYTKTKFGNPISVRIDSNDNVYVLDKEDNGYKVYDRDLNWVSTTYTKHTSGNLIDMDIDKSNDNVYILNTAGGIFRYDDQGALVTNYYLDDILDTNETFTKLRFSKIDDDILYVLTTNNVYKKFKTKLSKSIGAFRLSDSLIANETLSFIDTMKSTTSTTYEYVFVGGESTSASVYSPIGKIFKFDEQLKYRTIIYDSYKTSIFALSSVNVGGDEFVTSWTINKSLYKLLYNHMLFRDNTHSKYTGTYDSVGRPQYTQISYITDSDTNLFDYTTTLDNFVGINEPVYAEPINRCLKNVYELQGKLLDMCKEKYTNKYPYPTQVVEVS